MNKTITTFDGTSANRSECRYIKGRFYKKNSQCFLVSGRWYRINSGYIVYDYEDHSYVLKNSGLINGIVGIDDDNKFILGYFTANVNNNVTVKLKDTNIIALSENILEKMDYTELVYSNKEIFVKNTELLELTKSLPKVIPYKSFDSLPYTCRNLIDPISKEYNKLYSPLKPIAKYSKYIQEAKLAKGTFGVEFETDSGRIPRRFLSKLGIMPLRDGSIRGDEYVTIPFNYSNRDLKALEDICGCLSKYTQYNKNNSLHIHVRTRKFSKEFFIGAFLVNFMLEKDIFSIFPKYAQSTDKYKSSGKNYNNVLPAQFLQMGTTNHDNIFEQLYQNYSGGYSFDSLGSSSLVGHPSDTSGDHKWNISIR